MDSQSTVAPGTRGIVASILTFGLGFLIVATAIHLSLPNPLRLHADMRSEKLELLDTWKGGAYAAAFGSSHVNEGFDPRAFDDELSAMQRRTPSVNIGVEGGSQTEQRALALEFLHRFSASSVAGQQPCFVLLELNAGANFTLDHLVHPRAINIYDWSTTHFALGLSDSSMGTSRRLGRDAYALAAMSMHYTNVGMLSSYIFSPPINSQLLQDETEDGRRGLHVLTSGSIDVTPRPDASGAAGLPIPLDQKLTPGNYRLLEDLAAASSNPNLHLIYFVTPLYTDINQYPLYPETIQTPHGVEPILNLARPDLYPQLFTPKYWHDNAHLNEEGAAFASRLLADQLQAWYLANHRNPNCGG
jgi:hypothetical protein